MRKLIAVLAIIAMAIIGMAGAAEFCGQDPDTEEILIRVNNPGMITVETNVNGITAIIFGGENIVGEIPQDVEVIDGKITLNKECVAYWDSRWANGQNLPVQVIGDKLDAANVLPGDTLRLLPL